MLERIHLPPIVKSELDIETGEAWDAMLKAFDAAPAVWTHPDKCKCGDAGCARLLAFRRYINVYLKSRAIRLAHKRLQSSLDEYIADENERELELAHAEALIENASRTSN